MNRLLLSLALVTFGTGAARSADALYEITQSTPKVAVGATATASLTIKAKSGWHVNGEAPINLALTPPAGLSVKKAKLTRVDLAATTIDSARFDIPISATEAGKQSIAAEARFVICQEQACKPVKETLALAVEVTPAATDKKKAK
jgi:hypothetical protein